MARQAGAESAGDDDQGERGQRPEMATDFDQQRQLGGGQNDEEQEEAHGLVSSFGQGRKGPVRGRGSPPRTPPSRRPQ
jgi:hypothetical protein